MKSVITPGRSLGQYVVSFTPENDDEAKILEGFGGRLSGSHYISCRGFEYMKAPVEFIINPIGRSD